LTGLNYTRNQYQHQTDIEQTLNHQVDELSNKQTRMAEDIEKVNAKILSGEQRLRSLRENLITSRDQSNSMEKVCV
jgi:peptidoglycan hydrolase CwlO-like protein